ncbi:MAG: ArnT family glycosyltransferase [Candidatus Zixiibacteriota bacterium]
MKTKIALICLAALIIAAGLYFDSCNARATLTRIHPANKLMPKHIKIADNIQPALFIISALLFLMAFIWKKVIWFLVKIKNILDKMEKRRFIIYSIAISFISRFIWMMSFDFVRFRSDSLWYIRAARSILHNGTLEMFGEKTAFMPVGYPAFMALVLRLFNESIIALHFSNILLSVGTVVCVYYIGRYIHSEIVGRISAIFFIFLPSSIMFSTLFYSETGFTFFLILSLALIILKSNQIPYLIFSGLSLCIAIYFRPVVILLPFLLIIYIYLKSKKRFLIRSTVFLLAVFIPLLPWTIRNYKVFGDFVPVSTNGGYNLFVGNHKGATGVWSMDVEIPDVEGLDEVEQSEVFKEAAIDFIKNNPAEFVKLSVRKFFYLIIRDTSTIAAANGTSYKGMTNTQLLFLYFWAEFYYLMILGLFILGLSYKELYRNYDMGLCLLIIVYFIGIYTVFFGDSRFHFPILPLASIIAAFGFTKILATLKKSIDEN